MNDIRAILKIAARRLELNSFIGKLHMTAIVLAGIALLIMLADRATAQTFVPWMWVGPGLAVLAIGLALALWGRRRPSEAHVAVVVDERLDLREKLSTALHCQGRDDAFAQAAMEDAVVTAREARTRELVRRRFAITPPPAWWVSPLLVLLAIMISFLNPLDLFSREQQMDATIDQAKLESEQAVEAMVKAIQERPELAKALEGGELSKQGLDPDALKRPEDFKRQALKKATDIQKKLDDIINGEKGKTADALEKAMSQLKTPEDGVAKELADAMAQGNFQKAQEALKELMDKAQNNQLNEEQKKQLAEQLQNIAEQLDKLAQQQQQMQEALKQAGMDPNLAQNPQALQQAIQNNQNLNEQQKQQLQQMAQAQQAAQQMCQGMGQACQQMAQACKGGQQGQMGQAGQKMAQQLGEMEMMQQLLQQAQAAAAQCQGQCQGLGQNLNMQQAMQQWMQGGAMGNRGQGAGGKAPIAPTPTGTKVEQGKVQTVDGDIIARQLFEGPQVIGDSKVQLVKVAEKVREGFDEALTEEQQHIKYRDPQLHYFGELEKITKAIQSEEAAKTGESGKPAEGEPDAKEQPAGE